MLLYLVHVVRAFMPLPLIAGMLLALWTPASGRKAVRALVISLAAGLPAGILVSLISFRSGTVTAARVFLDAAGIIAAVMHAGTLFLRENRGRTVSVVRGGAAVFFTAALAASAVFSFFDFMAEQALSAVTVLNTELILNIGGILFGACLIVFLIPLVAHVSSKIGRGIVSGFLLSASVLLVIPWCAEVLLGLMRLELAEVASARLSFVAKVAKYALAAPYVQAAMIAALSLVFFAKLKIFTPDELFPLQGAERRKARSRALFDVRCFKSALASLGVVLAVLLYHDLYASRPPKISTPVRLAPDSSGLIKVRISDVADGKLHRYSSVTDDGHVVRFFLINRMSKRPGGYSRIGVVYDACMLCGDMGYIQHKNEVICIACNVRVFTPSIGKGGGCNPIPLTHSVEGDYIVISAEELGKGARYFTEVISLTVKDPVTGKELDTLKAPYRYEYKGRTYFFESEATEEKFRESPETYAGRQQSSYELSQAGLA